MISSRNATKAKQVFTHRQQSTSFVKVSCKQNLNCITSWGWDRPSESVTKYKYSIVQTEQNTKMTKWKNTKIQTQQSTKGQI